MHGKTCISLTLIQVLGLLFITRGNGNTIPVQGWQTLRSVESLGSQSEYEVGKFVSPTHRPPLPPGNIPGTHFC